MDYGARLRKKHLLDLIAYLKVSNRPQAVVQADTDTLDNEQAMEEY